ncbi:MAG: hypothetical protein ACRDOJ_01280 [Nocardioidaceae bacterium]
MTEPYAEDRFDSDDEFDTADVDPEAPEADVLEQHTAADGDADRAGRREPPLDADAADAADQARGVEGDEDEYRD